MALLGIPCRRDRFAKRLALALSLVVHGGLAAGAAALATQPSSNESESIVVEIFVDPPPDVLVPADMPDMPGLPGEIAQPAPALVQPVRIATRENHPQLVPAVPPQPTEQPVPAEAAAANAIPDDPDNETDAQDKGNVAVVPAETGAGGDERTAGQGGAGTAGMLPGVAAAGQGHNRTNLGARPLTSIERRALLDRYLKLIDPRIRRNFHYPRQAEVLEIEGDVKVVVAVDARGHLLRAHTAGSCPHALLCEDATRTVRAALPFPPPPPELGGIVEVELPLTYRLE
ncbi:MAG: TonB family protein [Deltaproteobacteria bacterium]|nr:TonB family protein [Deltaproteobacteria bacterium]